MFVWILEGKADDPEEIGRALGHWVNQLGPTVGGYLGATGGVTDDRRFILFTRFDSQEQAQAALARADLQAWYDDFQKHFDGDVSFTESGDVSTYLAGGSDTAGFVQFMKVAEASRERVDAADREFEKVAGDLRPDLIGGVRVWTAPDTFVEANYFTSEDDARDGEKQEFPAELQAGFADFMEMMKDAEYFDLTEPLITSA